MAGDLAGLCTDIVKLIEKYKQIEKQSYSQIQLVENRL